MKKQLHLSTLEKFALLIALIILFYVTQLMELLIFLVILIIITYLIKNFLIYLDKKL